MNAHRSSRRVLLALTVIVIVGLALVAHFIHSRRAEIWLPAYMKAKLSGEKARPTDLILMIADHYEPGSDEAMVQRWVNDYPRLFDPVRDSDGRPPQHTWFYPAEQFRANQVAEILKLADRGYGELELHLHHAGDDSASLKKRMAESVRLLGMKGTRWGFVHGNWALDNSIPERCGTNDEITTLREMGSYADFTFPAYGSDAQPATVNSIYYAIDDPNKPKSYDNGQRLRVGTIAPAQGFMIFEGPLTFYWHRGPHVEYGGMEEPATDLRAGRWNDWLDANVHVQGRPEWVFVKLHTHGAHGRDAEVVLSEKTVAFYRALVAEMAKRNIRLHFVTAREAYNIAKAAEAGKSGDAGQYRDFEIPRQPRKPVQ
jgi:hypothetical protein